MNDSTLHDVVWLGLKLSVPKDWEIVRHSVSHARGSLIFVDRRRQRLELGWLALGNKPDLERWAADLEREEKRRDAAAKLRHFRVKGGWRALERRAPSGEITTRAVRHDAATEQLVEAAVETRAGLSEDRDLVERLLATVAVECAPERARRLRAFDVDVEVPEPLRLEAADVKPADVRFEFRGYDRERGRELSVAASVWRLGMAESWYDGDAEAFIRSRESANRFARFSVVRHAGHEATLAEGVTGAPLIQRALGLVRARRVLVWACEARNALYAVATSSQRWAPLEPQALAVTCCGGAS
jgi:hypothetical protein